MKQTAATNTEGHTVPVAAPVPSDSSSRILHRASGHVIGFVRSSPAAAVGTALLLAWILIALFAPVLVTHSPVQIFGDAVLQPPSRDHLFGTDNNGMDVFSRVLAA